MSKCSGWIPVFNFSGFEAYCFCANHLERYIFLHLTQLSTIVEGSVFFAAWIKLNLHEIYSSICCLQQRNNKHFPSVNPHQAIMMPKRRWPSRSVDLDLDVVFCWMTWSRVREDESASWKQCREVVLNTGWAMLGTAMGRRLGHPPCQAANNSQLRQGKSKSENWD